MPFYVVTEAPYIGTAYSLWGAWKPQKSLVYHTKNCIFLCIFLFPRPVDCDGETMTHIYVFTKLASSMKSFCTCNKINAGHMLCFPWISLKLWAYDLQISLLHLYYVKKIKGLTWGDPRPVLWLYWHKCRSNQKNWNWWLRKLMIAFFITESEIDKNQLQGVTSHDTTCHL